ncbi:CcmD family protein [Candidatus Poribacteria bacterium]|nr:CcmD family protein [Candidatus Poribacteria bacterium]
MRIIIIITFIGILGLFLIAQIPVTLTSNEVDAAVSDAIAQVENAAEDAGEAKPQIDEDEVTKAVELAVEQLESKQKRRLKFLFAAYLVIWLAIMLYVLRLGRQQSKLEQRLSQLEQTQPISQEEVE